MATPRNRGPRRSGRTDQAARPGCYRCRKSGAPWRWAQVRKTRRAQTSAASRRVTAATSRYPRRGENVGARWPGGWQRKAREISCSFGLEQLAFDNFLDQRADAVLARTRALQNL